MIEMLSKYTYTEKIKSKNINNEEWGQIVKFVYTRMIVFISFIMITSIIAKISNYDIRFYIYFFISIYIRKYSGGFHFKNAYICFIMSIIVPILSFEVYTNINISSFQNTIIIIIGICIHIIIGNIDSENKKISKCKKELFEKKVIVILLFLLLINICLNLKVIVLPIIMNSVSLILGYVKNK